MQVLVVNPPEETLPEGTSDLVRSTGWDMMLASDYRTAVEIVGSNSVDAVIMTAPEEAVLACSAWASV